MAAACALNQGQKHRFECHDTQALVLSHLGEHDSAVQHWHRAMHASSSRDTAAFARSPLQLYESVLQAVEAAKAAPLPAQVLSSPPAAPLVASLPAFASAAACSDIVDAFDAAVGQQAAVPPLLCVTPSSPHARRVLQVAASRRLPTMQLRRNEAGFAGSDRTCVNVTEELRQGLHWSTSAFVYVVQQVQRSLYARSHSSCGVFTPCCRYRGESSMVDALEAQLESELGLPASHALSTQLVRYETGHEYNVHTDCFLGLRPRQRAVTALVYLTTPAPGGGGTSFPRLNLTVAASQGNAVVFSSLTREGFCDIRSQHVGDTVVGGTKYVQ